MVANRQITVTLATCVPRVISHMLQAIGSQVIVYTMIIYDSHNNGVSQKV